MSYYQPPQGSPQGGYYAPPGGPPPPQQYGNYRPPPLQNYGQQSYGAPPGPPPPSQGYNSYPSAPAVPQYGGYGAPPGPPPGNSHYGAPPGPPPPPHYQPPQQSYAPSSQPPQHQNYGPPAQQQQGFARPPVLVYLDSAIAPPPPNMPAPPVQGYNPEPDVERIRKATKGFGTDESALINTLAPLNALQIDALSRKFVAALGKSLVDVIDKETSSYFSMGLHGVATGPVMWDVELLHRALSGIGTHEDLLTEILMNRTNDEMLLLKAAYRARFHRTLEDVVRSDLSAKTERLFNMALAAGRTPDSQPVNHQQVNDDVKALYKAGQGKMGTDEITFCSIMSNRSTPHLGALATAYRQKHKTTLTRAIKKEFSGHMKDALLYIAESAKHDGRGAWRDAKAMEAAMKGLGTKDERLVWRIVRGHWSRPRMESIKLAYQTKYKRSLASRVAGETGGDYKKLMVALIG